MNETAKIIKVGIADMNIVESPNLIRTSGLGSCVGIVLYDIRMEMAGLAHIMLPDSTLAKSGPVNLAKYANTAVDHMFKQLLNKGAKQHTIKAKLAGGGTNVSVRF